MALAAAQMREISRLLDEALPLDAGLLAEVYLAMTRGQDSLVIDLAHGLMADVAPIDCSRLVVLQASAEELAAHEALLDSIEAECRRTPVWRAGL